MERSAQRQSPAGRLWLLTAILLVGAALRIAPLADNRLHPDEALFATLARLIITGKDPWLAQTPLLVDKPPLFYYVLAGGVSFSWASELTARLPGLFASLISLALVARLGWQLWRSSRVACAAALLAVLSPFAIAFSPTVFADPQLVVWMLAALVAVSGRRWGWGGMLFGLAFGTKQSALFFAPLVIGVGIIQSAHASMCWREAWGAAFRFALGFGLIAALMAGWDLARGTDFGFWAAGLEANSPGRLIRSGEVWPRAVAWWTWLRYFSGAAWINGLLLAGIAARLVRDAMRRGSRGAACALFVAAYAIAYLAIHWLVAFPVLDRYLLPLVPLGALLAGRALDGLAHWIGQHARLSSRSAGWLVGAALVALLGWPAWGAARNVYPVGGDHGAYDGIDEVAAYLRTLPDGTVVYYDNLGWTLSYYLFDAYVFPVSFASPAALAADLETFGASDAERTLVLPGWESHREVIDAVESAGFRAEAVLETSNRYRQRSFTVYRLSRSP